MMWVDESKAIDFSAHYRIGPTAVAWRLLGYVMLRDEDLVWTGIETPDTDFVRAVMVGDNRVEIVDVNDLQLIGEEDFCRGCGQIGCGCEVWS